uniref:Uncharacterized protein n=1 Tax=Chromera velia CCMP2878 TaxID=1169474 RepID=A0A0G4IA85_9ALVE|eukprot:Cvel_12393.t1-p1 / transcript=Cvel_12393.t1 / gene=Cvel_12393 / organism=Chromera_velia_CCMP2878 / gene_product=hypothetical protein / transcript_product=hypothetical protein / location=Cvel_scaffold809:55026-55565(-) / protein_length=180 / sequence_SO=supercontig / SO=protein_coding / is_pseudo=false
MKGQTREQLERLKSDEKYQQAAVQDQNLHDVLHRALKELHERGFIIAANPRSPRSSSLIAEADGQQSPSALRYLHENFAEILKGILPGPLGRLGSPEKDGRGVDKKEEVDREDAEKEDRGAEQGAPEREPTRAEEPSNKKVEKEKEPMELQFPLVPDDSDCADRHLIRSVSPTRSLSGKE